jgi:uncharacterized membrane protein YfcA
MDGMVLTLFVVAAFLGGFVSGFSGFAMGLVVSGVWLHIITPIQTATLIAGYGLLTQSYGIWKLRHKLAWKHIWPLTLGSTIGIPIGVMLLTYINATHLRIGVGPGFVCRLRGHHDFAERRRRRHDRSAAALCARPSVSAHRSVGRFQALWKNR